MKSTRWHTFGSSAYRLIAIISSLLIGLVACQGELPITSESASVTPPLPTGRMIATIPLDWKPTLIAQGNGLIWVVGREDHFVARLDPLTNQLIGQPTTLAEPIYDIVAGEGGIWVTGDTVVTRLDPTTGAVTATFYADQFGDGAPFRLAIGEDLIWLLDLIENRAGSRVHRIDPQANAFVGEVATVGIEAIGITFGAGSIWTANHDDSTVSRVDAKTNQLVATIKLTAEPHYIYFDPQSGMVWVANYHINSVSLIDSRTNQLVGQPHLVPFAPEWMTSGQGKVWVLPSPYAANDVRQDFEGLAEFDATNVGEARKVQVSGRPMDAVVSNGALWITTQDPSQVLRLDLQSK
jgi:YVTN family beta-propeller protein